MIGPSLFAAADDDSTMTAAPPLTRSDEKRRELELDLLAALDSSDEPVDALMNLWVMEKDIDGAHLLLQLEQAQGGDHAQDAPIQLQHAAQQLHELVQQHGSAWPEPMNRLALLYGVQGRYQPAYELVQRVLQAKPWHFEALQLQLLLTLSLEKEQQQEPGGAPPPLPVISAIACARQTLPPLSQPRKRSAWVYRAVQQAQAQLHTLRAQQDAFVQECQEPPVVRRNYEDGDANVSQQRSVTTTFPQPDDDASAWQ